MTVRELIDYLADKDPDAIVGVSEGKGTVQSIEHVLSWPVEMKAPFGVVLSGSMFKGRNRK